MIDSDSFPRRVAAVRRFSRFYTHIIGLLQEGLLQSRFSLTEARVLYELAQAELTATQLARELGLDPGYLSRILQRFEDEGLIRRAVSEADRRQSLIFLTSAGQETFAPMDVRSREGVGALLAPLPEPSQASLVTAMEHIQTLLEPSARGADWQLRPPRPGDIGWVVARHGALYAEEFGFDHRFEALVARVAADFLASHDPIREGCWIADRNSTNIGSVFLLRESDETARLRLLIVEPAARGLGVGQRLVGECIEFARAAGYRRIVLWTNDVQTAARAVYRKAGFHLINSTLESDFGPTVVAETWELDLLGIAG